MRSAGVALFVREACVHEAGMCVCVCLCVKVLGKAGPLGERISPTVCSFGFA